MIPDLDALAPTPAGLVVWGFAASLAAGGLTAVGALPVLLVTRRSEAVQNAMLGFGAGVMLAASIFSLILPAIEAARASGASEDGAVAVAIAALLIGASCLWLIHRFVPHEHFVLGHEGPPSPRLSRVWLFIVAITLHNLPEGLSVGVGFGAGDLAKGLTLALGIGLQNMPEGLAVAVALVAEGYSKGRALWVSLLTGLVEPIGGLIGAVAVTLAQGLLPWGLAFAGGAMLFVISDEIIPETHRGGEATHATFALLIGFAVMMYLDVVLG